MPTVTIYNDGTISYPKWVKRGMFQVNRDCLDADDPDQTYNFLKNFNIVPEDYGIFDPRLKDRSEFMTWSKEQLITEVLELRKQIENMEKSGFF